MKSVALIPAKSTSKRVPDKNIKELAGNPLMAYSIAAALKSQVFDDVVVSTDSKEYAQIAERYGAQVVMRPEALARPDSVDYQWVEYTLRWLNEEWGQYDAFSILRPTSPFRMPETIQRANDAFFYGDADSLRAVSLVTEHPGKMWIVTGKTMKPLMPQYIGHTPWHSCQTQSLPTVYVQNASLEMAWTDVVWKSKTISGENVMPFFTKGHEGFDINTRRDFAMAKLMAKAGVPLPEVG